MFYPTTTVAPHHPPLCNNHLYMVLIKPSRIFINKPLDSKSV